MNRVWAFFLAVCLLAMITAPCALCQVLNPYGPYNAIAAEPLEPYNLWQIPECSRTSYHPCPAYVPFSTLLPDVPPAWAPFPGPFGLPVPVP
ncbi:MAG TPA: hypothetical protein VK463_19510 [Desulfomonilaceae bacterium]|nr:hypothetical protein [Desulfomonilaceae bacterium]